VGFEHGHSLGFGQPRAKLGLINIEEQLNQVIVVDFSECTARDIAPVGELGLHPKVVLVKRVCIVTGGGKHEIHFFSMFHAQR
tara:strand:- start:1509 stop:1757 length:249 start_codon:yes stop_codon:yes gene_type:complete